MKKRINMLKIFSIIGALSLSLLSFSGNAQTTNTSSNIYNSVFFQNLNQLNIPIGNILLRPTLTRYDFTRLLNAVECQDCVIPTENMAIQYNQTFWSQFRTLPGKYFGDVGYLSGIYNGTNYYYCVAKIGNNDIMNGYPLGSSNCGGNFCGYRNVSKAEFFQTLSNLLMDRQMGNYAAPWKEIKERFSKLKTTDFRYKYFNQSQIELIQSKPKETQGISSRLEYTTYLGYCTFNPENCGFQTFPSLGKNVWPLAEANALIRAGIIKADDVTALNSPITPMDAIEKIELVYELHTKCEFDNDYDCDGIPNHEDNCPYNYNPSQSDIDGDYIGDVCDDDIDGDGIKNPVGLVDDNGKINYGLLKKYPSNDNTPLGDQTDDAAYFIQINSLNQKFPAYVQLQIIGPEAPANVEWDFGDLGTAKGKSVAHTYTAQGTYTVTAKVTTQKRKEYVISTQIFFGNTTDTSYNLNIETLQIDNNKKTASLQTSFQGNFEYLQWENSAIGTQEKLRPDATYITKLIEGERNNITVKGYVNNVLTAVASIDVYDNKGKFYGFTPNFNPLIKRINSRISANIKLENISPTSINNIKRDFGDSTTFFDTKLNNYHTYTEQGKKIIIQKVNINNGTELIAISTLNIQDPSIVGNQTYNIIPESSDNMKLTFKNIGLSLSNSDTLQTTLNGQESFSSKGIKDNTTFLEIGDRLGVVKVNTKYKHGNLSLENKGIISFGTKGQTGLRLGNINELFSGLKCDLDKDGIPDLYDDDIDGDGVPNLLGMIIYEETDCKLIVGANVDTKLYKRHSGICSLDNCPFRANPNQADLNANGIGDICENKGECGNGTIDPGEDCSSCPQDVAQCTAFCGNGIKEAAENCKNCPADMPICPSLCGNGKTDNGEECDNGKSNGNDGICTIACTKFNPNNPKCGNGTIDKNETCITCPMDLGDICIQPGITSCGDGKIDAGENCLNCPEDVGQCSATCPNGKQEDGETCLNCPKDMPYCPSLCGNGELNKGEECDVGELNGKNGKCGFDCKKINSNNPNCGNGTIEQGENCDNCARDLQDICIQPGNGICGNGILEEGETCLNCPTDAGNCTGLCGNGKIESAETCQNCPEDVGQCSGSCGNKIKEPGEECDNGGENGEDGKCNKECKVVDPKHYCGDKTRDENEECDAGTKNGTPGDLCSKKCTIISSQYPKCGNGVVDNGENCDICPIDLGDKCLYTCGNGKKEIGEACDYGENNGKNGICTFDCKIQKDPSIYCGNNKTEKNNYEECDHGTQNGKDGECDNNCKKIVKKADCGNGIVEGDEECDLGKSRNGNSGENCSSSCTEIHACSNGEINQNENCNTCPEDAKDACITPRTGECGNNIIEEGEDCKNCNQDVGQCTAFCGNGKIEDAEDCLSCPKDVKECTGSCGNGILESGEECDNGGENGTDGKCNKNCKRVDPKHYCGDGKQDKNEECDDGEDNGTSISKCSLKCTIINPLRPKCGNGEIDLGENCITCAIDLGNKCLASCGNGEKETGEECDSGSLNGKDGECSNSCKLLTPNPANCGNHRIDNGESCSSCQTDLKECRGSCGNGIKEDGEECDHGGNNGTDGKCSKECRRTDVEHYCGDGKQDEDESCDNGEQNGTQGNNCTLMCTNYDKSKPNCGNGKIDSGENCENCPVDLGNKCSAICGNGIIEKGETCDNGENHNGKDGKCTFECKIQTNPNIYCGNNITEKSNFEECDNNDRSTCSENCKSILPPSCGNGIPEGSEECDDGHNNGSTQSICSNNCTESNSCQNGKIDKNETCQKCSEDLGKICIDDGTTTPVCGNSIIEEGENCENCSKDVGECNAFCGNNKVEEAENCGNCSKDVGKCTGSCGNGILEPGEECDNGGAKNGYDGKCSKECKVVDPKHYCGDKTKDENEQCDAGPMNGTLAGGCTKMCTIYDAWFPNCGNGIIDEGEDCNNCPVDLAGKCLYKCGNNITEPGEECDNGDDNGKDGKCSLRCKRTTAKCGNRTKEGEEECDEGTDNGREGIECSEQCRKIIPPVCGDGILSEGEYCDMGTNNSDPKYNCSKNCKEINSCPNENIDQGEKCQNCANDLSDLCITNSKCGNGIIETTEQCDYKANNGKDKYGNKIICSKMCKIIIDGIDPDDKDCDGIIDSKDVCPNVPGPAGNKACLDPNHTPDPNDNGCPDPDDIDCDGVKNNKDKCPINPGKAGDQACLDPNHTPDPNDDGCVDPDDIDCDGVKNSKDKCPTVPGPAGDKACLDPNHTPDPNDDGCVDPDDIDCDGVKNNDDKCPNVPGPAGDKACTDPNHTPDPNDNGCIDPDDIDCDGIVNSKDSCINTPGPSGDKACLDPNHIPSPNDNGCPDPDDPDCDGIKNNNDKCPNIPGKAGDQACLDPNHTPDPNDDGCIDPDDIDCDGVKNNKDKCPINPGKAGDQACTDPNHTPDPNDDGCIDPDDPDCDGVKNKDDKCPFEPGQAGDKACIDPSHVPDPNDNGCPNPDDIDCDGVKNNDDKCPTVPGQAGDQACKDENHTPDPNDNGCPDPDDIDCDGVKNDDDICPVNPGKAGDQACTDPNHIPDPNDNGCIDPNNSDCDCDGIKNNDDLCPTIPGPAGDQACLDPNHTPDPNDNGCPDPDDIDCDGVKNNDDKCPTVPGQAGDQACKDENHTPDPNDNGCPNPDIDCDSVPDDEDECPTTPGNAGDEACLDPNYIRNPNDNGCPTPDIDCDCVPDGLDQCPEIPGKSGNTCCLDEKHENDPTDNGCPPLPDVLCEGDNCALVKPVCNSCPCQFADYSNTLQRDDSVRARLWDKTFKVHYNYSEFFSIGNLFNH